MIIESNYIHMFLNIQLKFGGDCINLLKRRINMNLYHVILLSGDFNHD